VIIVREITPAYYAPVGNWHIRETVRRAVKLKPIAVNPTRRELLEILVEHVNYNPQSLLSKSKLLKPPVTLNEFLE
jgi:hypothetical protein